MTDQIDELLNNAPCGFLSFTDDRAIALVNATLSQLLGYEADSLVGCSIDTILPIAVRIFCQTHFFPLLKLHHKAEEIYFSLKSKHGQNIPMLVNASRREEAGIFFNDCIFIPIQQRIQFEDEILKAKKAAEAAIKAQHQAELELRLQYNQAILLAEITQQIRQTLDLDTIFEIAVQEIRQFMNADRVGIFKFDPNSNYDDGEFVAESVATGFDSVLAVKIKDHCFGEQYAPYYQQGKIQAVANINDAGLLECHRDVLARFQIKANLIVPLLHDNSLWGLLCINQCSSPRQWQEWEINLIKQIANQLAIAIQQANLFQQVQTELEERKLIEIKLKETNDQLSLSNTELARATKAKSEFLANMSHEIRTPMNGVIGMAQLLSMTNLADDQREFVDTIKDSGDALLTIINDILDFSKIESGMLELESHPFNLKDILKSVCNLFIKQSSDKGIKLSYHIDDNVPHDFLGDGSRLRQIILNLVGNALKFTKQGQVIIKVKTHNLNMSNHGTLITDTSTALSTSNCLLITVEDTGIGINQDKLQKLFQPFSQADASISRKYGGTGLGLAISKSLINLMGGTIWIESLGNIGGHPPSNWVLDTEKPQVQGSTFYFTLIVKVIAESEIKSSQAIENSQLESQSNKSQLKILLAEDNKVNQKVATFTLKKLGYSADIANNGLEVLEMVEKQFYDIILMDMQMPEMDGITATKMIRQSDKPQPYIIALTANALEEDRQICLDVGMNDYISKPLAIAELTSALNKCSNHQH